MSNLSHKTYTSALSTKIPSTITALRVTTMVNVWGLVRNISPGVVFDNDLALEEHSQLVIRWWRCPIPAESDSLPHAHAQTTKTYYKHQDSRIKKVQELNTKTSANSDIQDLPKSYQDYQDNDYQWRLLESFQDDVKYEHVG
ncbi:hypothetical protein Tco_0189573 [Tanacetum coccineum]